jgi:hypothetical protein
MAKTSNQGAADRTLRLVVGIFFVGMFGFFPLVGHWIFAVLPAIGLVLAVTGAFGVCPIYKVLGITTNVGHGRALPPAA